MNVYVKVSLACLLLASLAASVQASEMSQSGGLRNYRTGAPAPAQYLAADNVVVNYHHYHLDKPIDGYEWVKGVQDDYLLVSVRSAIVRRIEYRPGISPEAPSGH